MVRPALAQQDVAEALAALALYELLKLGLVVAHEQRRALRIEAGEDVPLYKSARSLHAAVKIQRGDDGLHRIGQDGGALAPAGVLLAPAQAHIAAQTELGGHGVQALLADEARAQAEKEGKTFKYDKHCLHLSKEEVQRRLDAGEPCVIRQNVPTEGKAGFDDVIYGHVEVDCDTLDDNVLIKADGLPTYNFANVVDDHLMGITHVIRGSEYLSSTPKYNLLYKDFGWDIPTYIHCPPVMKDAQNKLSKRNGDASYQDLVAKGYLKEAVLNYILLLGWSPKGEREIFTLPEMIEVFDESGIGKAPAIFDPAKLRYINAEYIRAMSEEAFFEKAEPYIDSVVKTPCNKALLAQVLHQRCELMSDIPEQIDFIDEMPEYDLAMYTNKKMKTTAETAKEALEAILPVLEAIPADGFTRDAVHAALFALIEEKGVKNGFMLWPLRVAVSGKQFTPGGGIELAAVLGKEKAVARVKAAIQRL